MNIQRIIKHLLFADGIVRRAFPRQSLEAIKAAIQSIEQTHAGEIRFAVEGGLESAALVRGQSARDRAIEVFSHLRIWDTEHNNGVLIYVLLADRAVEIIADRGIHARVGSEAWDRICHDMELAFSRSEFLAGALKGVAAVAETIANHFPAMQKSHNELPDEPVLLV